MFSVAPTGVFLSDNQCVVLSFVTLAAKHIILLNCKNQKPITTQALCKDIMQHIHLEKSKSSLKVNKCRPFTLLCFGGGGVYMIVQV